MVKLKRSGFLCSVGFYIGPRYRYIPLYLFQVKLFMTVARYADLHWLFQSYIKFAYSVE